VILFFTTDIYDETGINPPMSVWSRTSYHGEDYLQDLLLIGFRNVYGKNVVDYPKKEIMYNTCAIPNDQIYGRGFTVWKTLEDIEIDRTNIFDRVNNGEFEVVIFSSIWRQQNFLNEFQSRGFLGLKKPRIVFIDGEDAKVNDRLSNKGLLFFGEYYKRENIDLEVNPISFSIPETKIVTNPPSKEKLFPKQVQCEIVYQIAEISHYCTRKPVYATEEEYYLDLQKSKYAITMRKAGWDCMRHYEIAANGAVPCFWRLSEKPEKSAPYGLKDMENVIAFDGPWELVKKIRQVEGSGLYLKIQKNALEWVRENSSEKQAKRLYENRGKCSIFSAQS